MARGFAGYTGALGSSTTDADTRVGAWTLQEVYEARVLNTWMPPSPNLFTKATSYGAFYNGTETELTDAQLVTGILIDGNATSNPDYPGAYKLVLGSAMSLEFHLWGSGGGGSTGHSGYTKYTAQFTKGTTLGLYLPGWDGVPTTNAAKQVAQWPDAGSGGTVAANHGLSGGGSARVGLLYINQTIMNESAAQYYAIAGGGGGDHLYKTNAGHGGGSSGVAAGAGDYGSGGGGAGSQSAGGTGGGASPSYPGAGLAGAKYQGGNGVANAPTSGGGGGGGGGYYGGGAGGTVYAAGGGGSGYIDTGFSGYSSGTTTAGSASGSPAGVGYTKPTGAGDTNKRGAIFFKKV